MAMNPTLCTTELEERLARDERGVLRTEVMTRLHALQARLQAEMRLMHPRERYQQIEAAAKAVDAALQVMPRLLLPMP